MEVTLIEIGIIGAMFSQFIFGLILVLKAKDEDIKNRKITYFLAGINFTIGGLILIPSLLNIGYSSIIFPLPAVLAYFGTLWTFSAFSMVIPNQIKKVSQISLTLWLIILIILRLIQNDFWLFIFIIGMFGTGFSIIGLILQAFHQKQRIFAEELPDVLLQSPRVFTLTGIGILIYILGPMIGESLSGILGENSIFFNIVGILIGVFIIGYALIIEMKYTQTIIMEALIEEKDSYQLLVEKLEEGVLLENSEGYITFVNPKICEMMENTEDELIGKHWSQIIPEEEHDKVRNESAKRPLGISSTYEAKIKAKSGKHIPVTITATPIFTKDQEWVGVLVVYVDITERKKAEATIQRARQQLQDMFDSTPAAVYAKDLKGRFILVNRQWRERTGLVDQEVIGKTFPEVFPQFYKELWDDNETEVLNSGISTQFEEVGKTSGRVYLATKFLLRNPEGDVYALCNTSIDITERKKIAEALREAKENYQMLIEKMNEGVVFEDENGLITFVNPRTCQILGYTEAEIIGKHWKLIVPPEYHERGVIETEKRPEGIMSSYESHLLTKDGISIPVINTATPIFSKNDEYRGVLVVSTDISKRKQVEDALKQVKLEEERYHAMLSHFINNDLHIIINNLDLLTLEYKTSTQLDNQIMNHIIDIAVRSSKTIDTVNKIFEVLQSHDKEKTSYNLLTLINKVTSKLESNFSLMDSISINQKSLDIEISGDKYLIEIFFEILRFLLSSKLVIEDSTPVRIEGSYNDPHFCILIYDRDSPPISNEISSRLSGKITDEWESQGHYIGISLASVIMQYYGGLLRIQPLEDKGNEFRLLFPVKMVM